MKLKFIPLAVFILSGLTSAAAPVYFPLNSIFGGAAYGKTITITAANTLITDGNNLWAGTYQNVPWPGTNPVVELYPNSYLLTAVGVTKAARFSVYASDGTNQINVASRITSGPLFYFGTNGMVNLMPSNGISFFTNADGSMFISSSGGGGSATNVFFGNGTNTTWRVVNGTNYFDAVASGGGLTTAQSNTLNLVVTNTQSTVSLGTQRSALTWAGSTLTGGATGYPLTLDVSGAGLDMTVAASGSPGDFSIYGTPGSINDSVWNDLIFSVSGGYFLMNLPFGDFDANIHKGGMFAIEDTGPNPTNWVHFVNGNATNTGNWTVRSNLTAGAIYANGVGVTNLQPANVTNAPGFWLASPSGGLASIPVTATNQFVITNETRAVTITNAANKFGGDGSLITGVTATIPVTATNQFALTNETRALIHTNAANIFGGNGSQLTGVTATIPVTATNLFALTNDTRALNFNNAANLFTGNGAGLTALTIAALTTNQFALTNETRALIHTNAANIFGGNGSQLTGVTATIPVTATNLFALTNDTRALIHTNAANIFGGNGAALTGLSPTQMLTPPGLSNWFDANWVLHSSNTITHTWSTMDTNFNFIATGNTFASNSITFGPFVFAPTNITIFGFAPILLNGTNLAIGGTNIMVLCGSTNGYAH